MPPLHPATSAIHADDRINMLTDVAPPIHTSTTFRYPKAATDLVPVPETAGSIDLSTPLVYSRLASSNINRLETILAPLLFPSTDPNSKEDAALANHIVSYSSGLSAFHALLVSLVPKVIAISGGYHGCHGVIDLHKRMNNLKTVDLHADDATWDAAGLGKGDIVHLETPLNPTGEAFNIKHYADRAHARGALLSVDSTFGPPGLQDPFAWGADVIMHSGTKYIGGHSDMLCGILAIKRGRDGLALAQTLRSDRIFIGAVLGSLEGWLGVRSLRTFELRVQRQSSNATNLVSWLHESLTTDTTHSSLVRRVVSRITHASLQAADPANAWLKKQMPNGYGPVFSIYMKTADQARSLPSHLQLFHHATSLGGVESLIEWRRMSDLEVDERLLRVSVGVEDWEDLRADLVTAFEKLVEGEVEMGGSQVDVVTGEGGAKVEGVSGAV